ncbi:MAG: hypothetical protein ACTSVK_07730 [Promethearchaeota archaeon]
MKTKAKEILNQINEVRFEPEEFIEFKTPKDLFDMEFEVKLLPQHPERSYEDRNVYVEMKRISKKKESNSNASLVEMNTSFWLNGELAIELGNKFVEAGNRALGNNRLQAYETIQLLAARNEAKEGKFIKVIIERVSDEMPIGYGAGFYYFNLTYIAEDDLDTRRIKDFVIYWSPFENEYKEQLKNMHQGLPVENFGWDWQRDIKEPFDRWAEGMK